MSFLNKFKKEFEGLNLGERLSQQQSDAPPPQHQYQSQQGYQGHSPQPTPQQLYSGQNQQNAGYQTHKIPGAFPESSVHQPYPPQQPPSYNSPSPAPYQPHHQPWSPPPGPVAGPQGDPAQSTPPVVPPYAGPGQSGPPCPAPPRWIAHWSAADQQWYYVETTGRTSWQAPSDTPPLESMPAYLGSLNTANRGQSFTHPPQPQYANPQDSRPSLQNEGKRSSSQTFLAAAGGFTAGGVAGYFVKDRIDKRKAKKSRGRDAADFADFVEYPAWEVGLECNICDQSISGPYAHCKKCDDGDYDICRDCLAQGALCDGKGKHNLVKVYPKYYCDICNQLIKGEFFNCGVCNDGDWDTCKKCFDKGYTCRAAKSGQRHDLSNLYIPDVRFDKGGSKSDSSSDSD
ncbi:zinc finger ZZ-type EF-hand domain-containing protein [Fusarium heterosporum]|uniref:Zinc finger ZZ-type EF-hand domain-containing protein n=1 Tax=Fusarium heterosporum TaxID=42747 RepID=A0A8H5TBG3_FUSHE|nr:zinc finger ZZ-type EF-hand domain-containing protein [Fusarium heterosporum]